MDRARYRERTRDLQGCADLLKNLTKMPDRAASAKDFQQVADLLKGAAEDIEALLKAELPGCNCRVIDHDDYSRIVYAESCRHHGHLFALEKRLKEGYARAEKVLKDEIRLRFVAAALTGAAPDGGTPSIVVDRAIAIADEAIGRLTKEVP